MSLEGAITILAVLAPIAKAIPVLGAPVEGSLEALSKILEFAKGVKSNKQNTKELAVQAVNWLNTTVQILKQLEMKADHAELEGLRPNVEDVLKALNAIVGFMEHCGKQRAFTRAIRKSKNEEELSKLRSTLEAAFNQLTLESHIRIERVLYDLVTANNDLLAATSTFLTDTETATLKLLKPVFSARYDSRDSPAGCLVNTREDVLRAMLSWVAEPSSPQSYMSVFWLAGLAGTGKSTIIKTFCERINRRDDYFLASFFASRSSAERRDPYGILHTFAYELATTSSCIRSHILSSMQATPHIMHEPMHEQVRQLLANSIDKSELGGRTIVLAIDALDECQKSDGVEGGRLIELLARALQHLPVKLVVASRQEDSLAKMFRSVSHVSLRLHEIGSVVVEADVRRIFDAGFSDIRRNHTQKLGTDPWPTQSHLNALVHLTGPFFIYAATVLKFVADTRFLPETRLDQVLERGSATSFDSSIPFRQIDALYTDVLKSATTDVTGHANTDLCRQVGDLLRTIVLLEEPVSVHALAHLMGLSEHVEQVDKDVRALASVLLITSSSGSGRFSEIVSTFHPSFRDFLVDRQRCPDKSFLVKPAEHQSELLYRCLQLLNKSLRYDVCGIGNPGRSNAEIEDLPVRLAAFVPEALRYACQFWPVHLVASGSLPEHICLALLEFCTHHLFHWLEILSLIGELYFAGEYFTRLMAWCQDHSSDSPSMRDILLLLRDTYRAGRAYAVPIFSHALQLYQSVLATGPSCKLLDYMRSGQIVAPWLVSQRGFDWSPILQVNEGHTDAVRSVTCSSNGAYIVSGSMDNTIRLWNAGTGQQLAMFKGHDACVWSVAFSPDVTLVVSGSEDKTVRVWDVETGMQITLLEGHSAGVRSVAFSPDGGNIISGSDDRSVRMWDVRRGALLTIFEGLDTSEVYTYAASSTEGAQVVLGKTDRGWNERTREQPAALVGHSNSVQSVAFSPDGAYIASGSNDKTIRVWDVRSGNQCAVFMGHNGPVLSVAFSHNGAHIASGSGDHTVLLWDAITAKQLAVLEGHTHQVQSVVFSLDGESIISCSQDKTVRMWDTRTGNQLAALEGHNASVWSVGLSADGANIVSGSEDNTVLVWDARSGGQVPMPEGHSNSVQSIAFSPDGAHVASGSEDNTIRMWSAKTGKQLAVLEGHNDCVRSVAFSPDGKHIVSASSDKSVRVWDAETGKPLAVLEGHIDWVGSAELSPDGAHVVSGSYDKTVRVWDMRTCKQLAVLEGHDAAVKLVAFSPDRALIVSGSEDKTVRLWDAETGMQLATLEGQMDRIRSVVFSPDGKCIISSDISGCQLAFNIEGFCGGELVTRRTSTITNLPHTHSDLFVWNKQTGWISWQPSDSSRCVPLCWVPLERRGDAFAWQGTTAAIGGQKGDVTILDFSDVIVTLQGLE